MARRRRFSQQYGIDFHETFSPVAKITTVILLIAIAASKNWKLRQMDVKNAFLHKEIDKQISWNNNVVLKFQEGRIISANCEKHYMD